MTTKMRETLLTVGLVLSTAVGYMLFKPAMADAIPICVTGTLGEFEGGCTIGDLLFSNLSFEPDAFSPPPGTSIITPDPTPLNPGFSMTLPPFGVGPNQVTFEDLFAGWSFDLSVLPGGHLIDDVSYLVDGIKPVGSTIAGGIALAPPAGGGGSGGHGLASGDGVPEEKGYGPPFPSMISVFVPLALEGGGSCEIRCGITIITRAAGGTAIATESFHFSEVVPEPATLILMASGLLCLAWVRHRRSIPV